jgi:hypothetical protein
MIPAFDGYDDLLWRQLVEPGPREAIFLTGEMLS